MKTNQKPRTYVQIVNETRAKKGLPALTRDEIVGEMRIGRTMVGGVPLNVIKPARKP